MKPKLLAGLRFQATWLSDTWAMDMASSQWSLLSPGGNLS